MGAYQTIHTGCMEIYKHFNGNLSASKLKLLTNTKVIFTNTTQEINSKHVIDCRII